MPKIITNFDPPPIARRDFDWSAFTDNYEPGHPVGRGATEAEAIDDLMDQLFVFLPMTEASDA